MRRLVSALAFLTVIPFPDAWKARKPNAMFAAYPVAAALIGCALAGLGLACSLVLPPLLMAIAVAAGGLFLTGGIHLDGLADCADAFYGRKEKARVLEILKDPRIGTMGGAAIGLALLTRCAALSALSPRLFLVGVPAAAVLSRTTPSLCLRLLPYVRSQGILPPGSSVSA
ncbi:MAG TPA: adenosylcobinamide-GDP ribazoletransferase, partial [bacterium]|nr:adenosylcobinamide-GDP ribazoletransferase [bacterium]